MSAHTPGLWEACNGSTVTINESDHVVPSHVRIRDVNEQGMRRTRFIASCNQLMPEHVANAHLIAAAPEMKEAIKQALAHVSELREAWQRGVLRENDTLGGTRSNRNVEVESALMDAIAKAEGK